MLLDTKQVLYLHPKIGHIPTPDVLFPCSGVCSSVRVIASSNYIKLMFMPLFVFSYIASQMWEYFHILALLIGDDFAEDDDDYHCFLQLQTIAFLNHSFSRSDSFFEVADTGISSKS